MAARRIGTALARALCTQLRLQLEDTWYAQRSVVAWTDEIDQRDAPPYRRPEASGSEGMSQSSRSPMVSRCSHCQPVLEWEAGRQAGWWRASGGQTCRGWPDPVQCGSQHTVGPLLQHVPNQHNHRPWKVRDLRIPGTQNAKVGGLSGWRAGGCLRTPHPSSSWQGGDSKGSAGQSGRATALTQGHAGTADHDPANSLFPLAVTVTCAVRVPRGKGQADLKPATIVVTSFGPAHGSSMRGPSCEDCSIGRGQSNPGPSL